MQEKAVIGRNLIPNQLCHPNKEANNREIKPADVTLNPVKISNLASFLTKVSCQNPGNSVYFMCLPHGWLLQWD